MPSTCSRVTPWVCILRLASPSSRPLASWSCGRKHSVPPRICRGFWPCRRNRPSTLLPRITRSWDRSSGCQTTTSSTPMLCTSFTCRARRLPLRSSQSSHPSCCLPHLPFPLRPISPTPRSTWMSLRRRKICAWPASLDTPRTPSASPSSRSLWSRSCPSSASPSSAICTPFLRSSSTLSRWALGSSPSWLSWNRSPSLSSTSSLCSTPCSSAFSSSCRTCTRL
mmetsp:Transcript_23697/g.55212  ORF Transcript_23697/g.55212 Transcript_23697/m.55212 type:complete len:224 (-) Transcript_23697:1509-2180(-)